MNPALAGSREPRYRIGAEHALAQPAGRSTTGGNDTMPSINSGAGAQAAPHRAGMQQPRWMPIRHCDGRRQPTYGQKGEKCGNAVHL